LSLLNLIAVTMFGFVTLGILALYYRGRKRSLKDVLRGETGLDQQATTMEPSSFMDRFERTAEQGGLTWNRSTYFAIAGTAMATTVLLAVTAHENLAILIGVAGLIGPYAYAKRMSAMRTALFSRQLPAALFMAASVLRAGGTLLHAVDAIAAEMPDPMGAEFKRIQQQMRLQVPAHEAMAEAQTRIGVREFAAVVVAARITAEVGGNLAHVFDQIAKAIVDAQNASRAVQAFTTEGRMSANMIAALPFVVMGLLHLLSPAYFEPLFQTWPGRLVLIGCISMIAFGWYTIRRMVDIRIY
jgi:tight adherence protein B